ncbi:response regulator [Spirosoma sp. BT702]|uniref:histidine kinase n=1 Tax=Spirosoma profusum TaxID=2771354 RepID=A0A927APT7_9BACT|nr:ATP-binding protein [Spirosoma profusum]MBD2699011.1 response regulator [Spirosoma profusum]
MRFIYLLFLFPISLFAQQTGWQELTISDGLSQGMIYDLKQDQKGFIWIATKDGLNRYDGHNFTVFTHDPYNEYSLSDNNCSALLVDSRGWLWVGTLNQGLNLFNTRTQRFYHLDIRDQTSANAGNYAINYLYEDPKGDIWVVADIKKLFKISLPDELKASLPKQSNLTKQVQISQLAVPEKKITSINSLSFRPDGQALAVYDRASQYFNWKTLKSLGELALAPFKTSVFFTTKGDINQNLWCVALPNKISIRRQGIQKDIPLEPRKDSLITLRLLTPKLIAIAVSDLLWLMSPEELMRQDSLTKRNAFTILPSNLYAITEFLIDQTGNVWVGTSGYGLRKFNPKIKRFQSLLPTTTLSYIYTDQQNRTYIRHEFAYDQLDWFTNRLISFLPANLPPADKRARYMMQDRQGTFWISNTNFQNQEMSLFKFSSDWKLLKKYKLPPNTAFGFYNNRTVEDNQGRLWTGLLDGKLLLFDPKTETFRVFSYQSLLPQKISEIETSALYFDQTGTLWIGTTRGLIRADHPLTNPVFSLYKNSTKDRQSLSNDLVSSLLDDPNQPNKYLWVGTKGGGLNRLNKQTRQFDHFTEKDGLPNKVVYGILSDEFKNLWLSTNRGLALFNPERKTFCNFTKADGLQDDEFNTGSFFKTPSGELLFGGVHGLTTFQARNVLRSNSQVPKAQLIGLKINNETVGVGNPDGILSETIENTQRIDLAHTQNLLTLEFGVMDFANSAKNRYRYRLAGIDKRWIEAGTNRFANYAQLPAGSYTFQMMGTADGQTWSKPVDLQVRVHPPFYLSWWAYLCYVLVLAVIGWQLYRFQTQRLLLEQKVAFEQKEAIRLSELDSLKTQFFTNISHEFRTPLTLILAPLTDLKQRYPAEQVLSLMERNGKRLLTLINQLLDLSKLEAGQLKAEPEPGDIAVFFRTLASSFSSLAQSRQIKFIFEQSETGWWTLYDRDKLEKIITNLLSNAFKFTPEGNEVRMNVRYPNERQVIVKIQDTGIGISPTNLTHIFERFYQVDGQENRAYEGTGVGLALVNELVQVLGGTINVTSQEGEGTTFTVDLPLVPIARPRTESPAANLAADWDVANGQETEPLIAINRTEAFQTGESQPFVQTADVASTNLLLIIDDNADIRAYVRSIFESDYQILEAIDGQDGLEKATQLQPNVVICDLMMPRLNGFEFCQALKTQPATSHIPVVMLTAKATTEDRIEGFELGADDYLTKPFNRTELQIRVRNLLEQRKRLYNWFGRQQNVTIDVATADVATDTADSSAPALALLTNEQVFIDRLTAVVHEHLDEPAFSVEVLSETVNLSRSQLHRKLKTLLDTSPTNFVRDIRLMKAAELLTTGEQTVTQIAYTVGFDNLSYFAKTFQERFGVSPSQYGRQPATPT